MSEEVISVRDISKRYRLGLEEKKASTFVEGILQLFYAPIRNFKRIRGLSKTHGDDASIFWALRDINFSVMRGEVLGLIGHNGAGKSTLLKILSSITEPTSGEVHIRGRVSSLLEVGTGFHPELSGRENVYMNGTILGMTRKEIDRKFDEIVDFSGVQKHIDTPVKFYSSGMKVRLGFAVAAHLEPEILIVDEVLAVGDAEFQRRCLGKMKDVSSSGRTVLFVSHNMAAVKALCTRSIVLENGTIVCNDATSKAIEFYQNKGKNKVQSSRTWDVPTVENDSIRLKQIEILPLNGNVLDIDTPFKIKLQLVNAIENRNLGCNIRILNRDQLTIFVAGAFLSIDRDSKTGQYQVEFNIPSFLLNSDVYSVDVMIGQDQRTIVFEELAAINFEILNTATGRGSNMGLAPGVIRPVIDSKISFEPSHEMHH